MKTTKRNLIQLCLLGAVLLQAATSSAQPVTKIAAGGSQSFFLKSGGSLWVMGLNDKGQLGDTTYNPTNRPEKILGTNVTAIAAGIHHTLFLKSDGSLWAVGDNESGELGDGTVNSTGISSPEKIVASGVTAIAAGEFHSLFLMSDKSLWAMGYNYDGELGDTTFSDSHVPEKIVTTNVTAIAAGEYHSLFLKSDGSLWAMGWNQFGQLGDGNSLRPDVNSPARIVTTNVTAIAAGWNHSLFLKDDGSLWAMGNNAFGQLGDGTLNSTGTNSPEKIVTAIAAGQFHSVFLKSDGSFWGMGYNSNGELGDRTLNNTNRTEQILAAYNRVAGELLSGNKVRLSFVGLDGTNYALDRTFNLVSANWVPQTTNRADSVGVLVLTNTPVTTTNNFWRTRSVP
jgi:alpha-tubulin suppressor-like RCC1 family protein